MGLGVLRRSSAGKGHGASTEAPSWIGKLFMIVQIMEGREAWKDFCTCQPSEVIGVGLSAQGGVRGEHLDTMSIRQRSSPSPRIFMQVVQNQTRYRHIRVLDGVPNAVDLDLNEHHDFADCSLLPV